MSQETHQRDALDGLLADFFQSRMPHPWPAAPVPVSAEPARPAARSTAEVGTDATTRARLTLAASVAFLFGACWYLSGGGGSSGQPGGGPRPGGGPNVLPDSTAKVPSAFEKNRKDDASKTKDPMTGFRAEPITLP